MPPVRVANLLLVLSLSLILAPAALADPVAPPGPPSPGCPWIVIRDPDPDEILYGVDVDPYGCLREKIRRVIGWR